MRQQLIIALLFCLLGVWGAESGLAQSNGGDAGGQDSHATPTGQRIVENLVALRRLGGQWAQVFLARDAHRRTGWLETFTNTLVTLEGVGGRGMLRLVRTAQRGPGRWSHVPVQTLLTVRDAVPE